MARNVNDAAMLLDVMAGYDSRDPMSLDDPAESFEEAAIREHVPPRIAFSPDLGVTRSILKSPKFVSGQRFEELDAHVEKAQPDFQVARMFSRSIARAFLATSLGCPNSRRTVTPSNQKLSGM